jgi:hypothetical protein
MVDFGFLHFSVWVGRLCFDLTFAALGQVVLR